MDEQHEEVSSDSEKHAPVLTTLDALLDDKDPAVIARVRTGMLALSTEKLNIQLADAYRTNKRVGAYLINEELTRRGFPPCFRRLPDPMTADLNQRFDIFIADAQWIASRYPEQKVNFMRYSRLFRPDAFHTTATFIFYFGKTPAWKIVKGLNLSEDQQWECHWLHSGPQAKKYKHVKEKFPKVKDQLWQALFHGPRGGQTESECIATIDRRRALWLCGAMANNRPQRTADLFEMFTGEKIARNLVAKQLEKIKRDIR